MIRTAEKRIDMELTIEENVALDTTRVSIACPRIDDSVRRVAAAVEMENECMVSIVDGYLAPVNPGDVLYIEIVDRKTFLYKEKQVLESLLSLTDLESKLKNTPFVRASRQMMVNLMHVKAIRPYLNARLDLAMDNGEHIIASRQFAKDIKRRIGL